MGGGEILHRPSLNDESNSKSVTKYSSWFANERTRNFPKDVRPPPLSVSHSLASLHRLSSNNPNTKHDE